MIRPGTTNIQGQACYLVEDFISSSPPADANIIMEYRGKSIFCSASEVARLRKEVDLPLYGIWQVLIASKVLDEINEEATHVLYFSSAHTDGQILYFDEGEIASEEIVEGGASLAGSQEIIINLDSLILPQDPIRSSKEKYAQDKASRRKRVLASAALAVLFLLTYGASSLHAQYQEELLLDEQRLLSQKKDTLQEKVNKLTSSYIKKHHMAALFAISYLNWQGMEISVDSMLFGKMPYQLVVLDHRDIPKQAFDRFEIRQIDYLVNGGVRVIYQ